MGLLDGLLNEAQERTQHQQFADRFEQHGDAGISDEEALQQHERVAQHATPAEYQQAALAAFQRMTPQQRKQFRQEINHRMGQRGQGRHGRHAQGKGHEPGELAELVGGMHSQNPSMLGSLMGGGGGMGGPIGKMALGGIAAMAVKQLTH